MSGIKKKKYPATITLRVATITPRNIRIGIVGSFKLDGVSCCLFSCVVKGVGLFEGSIQQNTEIIQMRLNCKMFFSSSVMPTKRVKIV